MEEEEATANINEEKLIDLEAKELSILSLDNDGKASRSGNQEMQGNGSSEVNGGHPEVTNGGDLEVNGRDLGVNGQLCPRVQYCNGEDLAGRSAEAETQDCESNCPTEFSMDKSENGKENGSDKSENGKENGSDSDNESESESEEEEVVNRTLRKRSNRNTEDPSKNERVITRQISQILKKDDRSQDDEEYINKHPKMLDEVMKRQRKRQRQDERKLEVEDSPEVLAKKCMQLAKAIQKAKNLVVYTGAGISTAANIPDYRGPNGVWTMLAQGNEVPECNLDEATPTFTHMALFTLYKKGKLKHVVSQNCDGLHMRSGLPRHSLSEIHGNMFIEICKHCKPMRPFVRRFDVTERTNKNRHTTNRRCYVCGNSLFDTIVHFGERGSLKWPINWSGATKAAEKADMILCLGSSLKVLRRYSWLWCMDRPKALRPKLYIINLQWTPKDSSSKIKINGRCDQVMQQVLAYLDWTVPEYYPNNDPILSYATDLNEHELHTCTKKDVVVKVKEEKKEDEKGNYLESIKDDHSYASPERPRRAAALRGRLVTNCLNLDYKHISWPRDALYLPYEPNFEYIDDEEEIGQTEYVCDCCDPAKNKKLQDSDESDSEESDTNASETTTTTAADSDSKDSKSNLKLDLKREIKEEIKQEDDIKEEKPDVNDDGDSTTDSTKGSSTPPVTLSSQPGWFGKGRRKRAKFC